MWNGDVLCIHLWASAPHAKIARMTENMTKVKKHAWTTKCLLYYYLQLSVKYIQHTHTQPHSHTSYFSTASSRTHRIVEHLMLCLHTPSVALHSPPDDHGVALSLLSTSWSSSSSFPSLSFPSLSHVFCCIFTLTTHKYCLVHVCVCLCLFILCHNIQAIWTMVTTFHRFSFSPFHSELGGCIHSLSVSACVCVLCICS